MGCIYGDPHHAVTAYIYERILFYSRSFFPLCLVGDFNSILMSCEKMGGNNKKNKNMNNFRRMVQSADLVNLGYCGPAFTWSNNQQQGSLIMQRLDRALASTAWTALFPSAAVYHLPRFNSDHHPILLHTAPPPLRIKKHF